jgi:hypothetical protein
MSAVSAALPAGAALQRGPELPDRRVPRPTDGLQRQARPHLAAIAFDLHPAKAAVEALPDRRRWLRRPSVSLHAKRPSVSLGTSGFTGVFLGALAGVLIVDLRRADPTAPESVVSAGILAHWQNGVRHRIALATLRLRTSRNSRHREIRPLFMQERFGACSLEPRFCGVVSDGVPAEKTAGNRRQGAYPGFIEPALATSVDKVPNGERWIHEIKFHGYRVQFHIVNENTTVFTRNGNDWTRRFKKIANDAFLINASSAILDGEVVVPAADGTADFSVLQNELKGKSTKIVMVAFDLLYLKGYDLRKLPLQERKIHLKKLIDKTAIQFSESFEIDGAEMYQHSCAIGLEGVVSKVRDSRYSSRRNNNWVKVTCSSARRCRLPASRWMRASSTASLWDATRASTWSTPARSTTALPRNRKESAGPAKAADPQDATLHEEGRALRRLGRAGAAGLDRVPGEVRRGKGAASVFQGITRGPVK